MTLNGTYKTKTVGQINKFSNEEIQKLIEDQFTFLKKQKEIESVECLDNPTENDIEYSDGVYQAFKDHKFRKDKYPDYYVCNIKKVSITLKPFLFKDRTIPRLKIILYFENNETKVGNLTTSPSIYDQEKQWRLWTHEIVSLNNKNEPSSITLFPSNRAGRGGYFCFGTMEAKIYENSHTFNIINIVSIIKELYISDVMTISINDWNKVVVPFMKGKKQSYKPCENKITWNYNNDNVKH